jgi:RimJ/RimL family protein N-acetyltransferase
MIKGKNISLRAIEKEDAKNYYSWINDSETNKWRGLYHPTSELCSTEWILQSHSQDSISFAIIDEKNYTIGFIGLRNICTRSRRAEIWIYIGEKSKWGKGLGTDAISTFSKYSFNEMNLYRLWLECDPENIGAVRCYEKNGYIREGLLRKSYYRNGKYRNSCIMSLLKDDFDLEIK